MGDHDPCGTCGFADARCACPKNVPTGLEGREDDLRRLAESVLDAVRKKRKEE